MRISKTGITLTLLACLLLAACNGNSRVLFPPNWPLSRDIVPPGSGPGTSKTMSMLCPEGKGNWSEETMQTEFMKAFNYGVCFSSSKDWSFIFGHISGKAKDLGLEIWDITGSMADSLDPAASHRMLSWKSEDSKRTLNLTTMDNQNYEIRYSEMELDESLNSGASEEDPSSSGK